VFPSYLQLTGTLRVSSRLFS